jgi:hypothetical protein
MIDSNASQRTVISHHGLADRTSTGRKLYRAAAASLIAIAGLALGGCATGGAGEVGYVAPPSVSNATPAGDATRAPAAGKQAPENKVVGVWVGESQADCNTSAANRCNARQEIRITLIEGESGLTGYYRCAYGTMNCYNMNETGKIVRATLSGNQMTARVQMPDGTSCIYTGRTVSGNGVNGGYSCYGGGSLIESGTWKGRRSY